MVRLDDLINAINDDLKDCLTPVRDRFRFALSTIFDYSVANPTQGNAGAAQSAINSTFSGTYADGLVSPGIDIDTFTQSFVNRHGVGANINQRWVSVRDYIVERSSHKSRVLGSYEEGVLLSLPELWFRKIAGGIGETVDDPAADLVYTETRETTPGPTFNMITERRWESASLGKTVIKTYTNVLVGNKVEVTESPIEVI